MRWDRRGGKRNKTTQFYRDLASRALLPASGCCAHRHNPTLVHFTQKLDGWRATVIVFCFGTASSKYHSPLLKISFLQLAGSRSDHSSCKSLVVCLRMHNQRNRARADEDEDESPVET